MLFFDSCAQTTAPDKNIWHSKKKRKKRVPKASESRISVRTRFRDISVGRLTEVLYLPSLNLHWAPNGYHDNSTMNCSLTLSSDPIQKSLVIVRRCSFLFVWFVAVFVWVHTEGYAHVYLTPKACGYNLPSSRREDGPFLFYLDPSSIYFTIATIALSKLPQTPKTSSSVLLPELKDV